MYMSKKTQKKGFTLIEGALVLGLGGLIFAMVFFVLPTMQRAQRDAQRKTNLSMIVAAMNDWNNTHRYTVSDAYGSRNDSTRGFCKFYKNYVGKDIVDPITGEPYKAALWSSTKVVDCITGKEYERGELDKIVWVHPDQANDSWAAVEVGDIQYDNSAYCDGERFIDHVGKNEGRKIFAFRVRLENGGYYCQDNGSNLYSTVYKQKK